MREALEAQAQLRRDGIARIEGRTRSRMLWSTYAASLFDAKVTERKIRSVASRQRWADTLTLLVPAFGMLYVDELRYAELATWRDKVARWIRDGMPSRRKRDAGKNKVVRLSPVTASGWLSILKVICGAMTKHFELDRNPAAALEYFPTDRTYTREQPNALTARQVRVFLATMKRMFPQHYAIVFFGFITGARPSTLRPLRRQGDVTDLKWDELGRSLATVDETQWLQRFQVYSDAIAVGGKVGAEGHEHPDDRYPYPSTENWQKTIGGHGIWIEVSVDMGLDVMRRTLSFEALVTIHAVDVYNFNPKNVDIATGLPDAVNGRFQITGLGAEFPQTGEARRRLTFEAPTRSTAAPAGSPP